MLFRSATAEEFEKYMEERKTLSPQDQRNLYELKDLKKIRIFLKYEFFCIEVQRNAVKEDNLEVVAEMLKNWDLAVPIHATLINQGSDEMLRIALPKVKLSNVDEIAFVKKASVPMLRLYCDNHSLCKKADEIRKNVRRIH